MPITKPVVNGSSGTWGTILNQALDDLQTAIDTNAGGIATTNANVTTLSGRVTTAEGNISTLQAGSGFYSGTAAARASDTHYNVGGHWYDTDTKMHWVGDGSRWVPMPGSLVLKVRQTTAQTNFTDGSLVDVVFNTEDYDRLGGYAATSSSTTYTPGIPGWYELTGGCSFTSNASGLRLLRWKVNGTLQNEGGAQYGGITGNPACYPARTIAVLLNSTDTLGLNATVSGAGSTLSALVSTGYQPHMTVKYLGPA